MLCDVQAVNPGFINLKLDERFVADYLDEMETDEDLGLNKTDNPKMIVIDYGGPNVAKPLHVGHLRSAIIGESVKRISRKWDIMFLEISIWETGDIRWD